MYLRNCRETMNLSCALAMTSAVASSQFSGLEFKDSVSIKEGIAARMPFQCYGF